jgi:hypothetical protein
MNKVYFFENDDGSVGASINEMEGATIQTSRLVSDTEYKDIFEN